MWKDPIVEEVRETREKLAQRFGYNIEEIVADARRRQDQAGRKVLPVPEQLSSDQKDAA